MSKVGQFLMRLVVSLGLGIFVAMFYDGGYTDGIFMTVGPFLLSLAFLAMDRKKVQYTWILSLTVGMLITLFLPRNLETHAVLRDAAHVLVGFLFMTIMYVGYRNRFHIRSPYC